MVISNIGFNYNIASFITSEFFYLSDAYGKIQVFMPKL